MSPPRSGSGSNLGRAASPPAAKPPASKNSVAQTFRPAAPNDPAAVDAARAGADATASKPVPPETRTRKVHVRGRQVVRLPESPRTPPVLVRQVRGGVVESRHRGSIVEVSVDGSVRRVLGDPDGLVNLRSVVKPFGLVALIEAGGVEEFDLSAAELAVMAGSHSGEDVHVRTLQAVFRRSAITQQFLGCGSEGAPIDALTAARLARDGEKPGPLRHMCSGQHASMLLLCRINGWSMAEYWRPDHQVQRLYASTVARAFATTPEMLVTSVDACGVPTYAFPLYEIARAFAMLADPAAMPESDSRASLAGALIRIRDAMLASPELVAGSRDRLDTSIMKALPGRIVSKGGSEGLRGFAIVREPGGGRAAGIALKIEDGGGFERACAATSIETLRQVGLLDAAALRALGRYYRPVALDPRGEVAGEAVAGFELAPVGELL
jgi:L-asparaginase II